MTTWGGPPVVTAELMVEGCGVTFELMVLLGGPVTTTWPLGTSQTEPTWVVTAEPTGGQPGMPVP